MWTGDLGIAWPDTKHYNVLAMGYLLVTAWVGVHCLGVWAARVRRAWRTGFAPDSVLSRALTHQAPGAARLADDLILHLEKNPAKRRGPRDEFEAQMKEREAPKLPASAPAGQRSDKSKPADLVTQLKAWRAQQAEDAPPFLASAVAAWLAFLWHGAVALLVTALWPVAFAPLFVVAYFVPLVVHALLVALVGWGLWGLVRRYIWKRSINKS